MPVKLTPKPQRGEHALQIANRFDVALGEIGGARHQLSLIGGLKLERQLSIESIEHAM